MSQNNAGRALSLLVGRADELKHLKLCWEHAQAGNGNTVVISGEAGIGKSRLATEMQDHVHTGDALVMRLQCSPLQSNSDLHPLEQYLAEFAGTQRTEAEHLRRDKIQKLLPLSGTGETLRDLLDGLVAIGGPIKPANDLQSPQFRREQILQGLMDGLAELTRVKPLLIIVEDAQWLDPTSSVLLERMVRRAHTQPLLILVTARREYDPSWIGSAHTSIVIPHRLSDRDTLELAQQIAGNDAFGDEELRQLIGRSEGVPLFIEELSRYNTSFGATPSDALKIPASLQAVLQARLDKVGAAKYVAQIGSALGRRFNHDVAAAVWGGSAPEFDQLLATLMSAELLLPMPIGPGALYSFRHVLFQEAAYSSLLREQRTVMHAQIVRAFAITAPNIGLDQPEIMAHHCERAEFYLPAAEHWLAAGMASVARGSVAESINYFKLGLKALERNPPSDRRERLDFELHLNLGPALMALKGYACSEGLATFLRARQLLTWSRSSLEEIHVLLGLFNVHFGRGEFPQALEVAHQADHMLSIGYGGYPVLIGQTQCMMGDFQDARRNLEHALERYAPTIDANSGLFCRADVIATCFLAKVEFALGNLHRCIELTRAAKDLARQQGHPLALAIAYLAQLFLATEAGDLQQAHLIADQALDHVTRHNLDNYRVWIAFHRAALSVRTNTSEALATMHQLLAEADAAGTLTFRPAQLGLLGAAYASMGKWDEALALIDQGLETARFSRGLEAVPALHRLRAKTLLQTRPSEAIRELEMSLAMAQMQSARMEELRSATVLARMLKDTEREGYAKELLGRVYRTFTLGPEFPDLKQAGRVLASLGETI